MPGPQTVAASGNISDRELIFRSYLQQIAAGNAQALASLYDATVEMLYSFALRIVRNSADAEEVLLDVFQQVWGRANTFDPERGTVWRWLILLTRSRALDRVRASAQRHGREQSSVASDWGDVSSEDPLPDETTIFRQQQQRVRQALDSLPADQRQAIELAYFSELSHSQIAAALKTPLGTIKTRIRIGMQKLRLALNPPAASAQAIQ